MAEVAVDTINEHLGKPLPIRFSRIERFKGQPRTYFPQAGIVLLADSIQNSKQEVPIKVTTKPGHPGHFILIDGERRLRAFEIIFERTGKEPLIDAFIDVVPDLKTHFKKSVVANLHREDLYPLDEAAAYYQLRSDGETIDSLAQLRGRSTTYVENYLKLHMLPDVVKKLMDPELPKETQLNVTQAIDIARGIPESAPALRIAVAREAIERNLGVVETRVLVQHRSRGSGHRPGGRLRKPSDDYQVFTSFLGRTRTQTMRFLNDVDLAELYMHRLDEDDDREKDLVQLDAIISALEKIRKNVSKKS